ncbi:hypothetical protein RND81_03G015800 [Saponaria officinalis]|uniref:GRF-type domain-containing protein n=1 Tax=Saponaria officinalis TaxID=3572 RepID=A0AAW1M3J4_SAPOF
MWSSKGKAKVKAKAKAEANYTIVQCEAEPCFSEDIFPASKRRNCGGDPRLGLAQKIKEAEYQELGLTDDYDPDDYDEELVSMSEISSSSGSRVVNRCFCGIPVTVKKSSTTDNPGRRFETCKLYNPVTKLGGCNYFRWFDTTQTDWQRVLINNLNLRENLLSKELELKQEELTSVKEEKNRLALEVEMLK